MERACVWEKGLCVWPCGDPGSLRFRAGFRPGWGRAGRSLAPAALAPLAPPWAAHLQGDRERPAPPGASMAQKWARQRGSAATFPRSVLPCPPHLQHAAALRLMHLTRRLTGWPARPPRPQVAALRQQLESEAASWGARCDGLRSALEAKEARPPFPSFTPCFPCCCWGLLAGCGCSAGTRSRRPCLPCTANQLPAPPSPAPPAPLLLLLLLNETRSGPTPGCDVP